MGHKIVKTAVFASYHIWFGAVFRYMIVVMDYETPPNQPLTPGVPPTPPRVAPSNDNTRPISVPAPRVGADYARIPARPQDIPPTRPPGVQPVAPAAVPPPQPEAPLTPAAQPPQATSFVAPPSTIQPAAVPLTTSSNHTTLNGASSKKRSKLGALKGFLSVAFFVGGVVVAAMLINQFIFQSYYVDGTSMTPTLHNDDRLIIDKIPKTAAALQGKPYIPKRGEIVVLNSSILDQRGNSEQLIKRVIGLPGDTMHIKDGVVTISNSQQPSGFRVDDSLGLRLEPTFTETPLDTTITAGKIFVLGDNRIPGGSYDSRTFGSIDSSEIEGRLAARIFPFDHVQLFQ